MNTSEQHSIVLLTQGDDFGCNRTITETIVEAHQYGILKNVSVMVNAPYSREAALRYAGMASICYGLHLTVTSEWDRVRWGPVSRDCSTLTRADGTFYHTPQEMLANGVDVSEILEECAAQLAVARSWGYRIVYVDTHMRFEWIDPKLEVLLTRWCQSKGLIYYRPYNRPLPEVGTHADPVVELLQRLDAAEPSQYLLLGHPAHSTEEMLELGNAENPGVAVAANCDRERQWFMSLRILRYCRSRDIRIVRYDELDPPLPI